MNSIFSILLGITEGLTEFLPISSTAHLVIASSLLGIDISSDSHKVFEIAIQVGAAAAIPCYYFKRFLEKETILLLVSAFIPTAILGLVFKKMSLQFLESLTVIAWALIIGGIVLIIVEVLVARRRTQNTQNITPIRAALIGTAQALALIPGTSRSGATIVAGLLLGIPRATIAEFSFLLSVPTIGAATFFSLLKLSSINLEPGFGAALVLGIIVSFITALIVIHVFMKLIRKYSFIPFGIYRIILGLFILIFFV
jgi:undecaprenyl-diphosphatase